jgi:hypothetical protein
MLLHVVAGGIVSASRILRFSLLSETLHEQNRERHVNSLRIMPPAGYANIPTLTYR